MVPGLNLPDWTVTFVIALVVLGFPIAVIMGWMFDLGPRGAERTIEIPAEADPGDATLTGSDAIADTLPAPGLPLAAPAPQRQPTAVRDRQTVVEGKSRAFPVTTGG